MKPKTRKEFVQYLYDCSLKLPVDDFLVRLYGDDIRTIEGLTEKVFGEGMKPIKSLSKRAMLKVLFARPGI